MALTSGAADAQALDALDGGATNLIAFTGLNTGSPSNNGANEYPGVTRQSTSWNAASGGTGTATKTNSSALSFTTDGTTAVTDISQWSAVSAGTYGIGAALSSSVQAESITIAAGAITYSAS